MSQEIIKTAHVLGLQDYINYETMNPVEITLDSNEIIKNYQNIKSVNIGSWSKIYHLIQTCKMKPT